MIGIDTNILLRFFLDDEPAQGAMARQFMSERTADASRPIADIADYLVVWAAANAGCAKTFTFDRKAARKIPGMELLA